MHLLVLATISDLQLIQFCHFRPLILAVYYHVASDNTEVVLMKNTVRAVSEDIQCVPLATEPGIEDIATTFEQEYVRCVSNEDECVCSAPDCCDMEQRSASQW